MNNFEIISIVIASLALFLTIGGLYYAGNQIRLTREQLTNAIKLIELTKEIHQGNHDWNRRIAAQDAIVAFRNQNKTKELRDALGGIDINDAIPLKTIIKKFGTNSELKGYIHSVLNTFEGYSRGILQGIYDEEVIKKGLKGTMIRYFNCFRPYIIHIRETRNPLLYNEFEGMINRWKTEETKVDSRSQIGNS
ncbi:MAG: DUF4760 domain-containing protein [Flavobacteriales bacterium]|nr:DUF4760 domain-containing protein [Flavobacteriales bacterium]